MLDKPRFPRSIRALILPSQTQSLLLLLALASCGDSAEAPLDAEGAVPKVEFRAPDPPGTAISAGVDWKHDQRLQGLLGDCYGKGHFNRDTSDMLHVLVEKLLNSEQSVLRHIREELAKIGEPALLELARVIRRGYSDRHASHDIVNAIGVFRMSEAGGGPTAMEVYKLCLGHPQESIRIATVRALTDHPGPVLYEDLLSQLPLYRGNARQELLKALYTANPARLAETALEFLLSGENPDLHDACARIIAHEATPELAVRVLPLMMRVTDRQVLAFLAASLEQLPEGGNEAMGLIDEMLKNEDVGIRADGFSALQETNRTDWALRMLRDDPHPDMRGRALTYLSEKPETPQILNGMLEALNSEHRPLRESALKLLLARGNERAADTALELWGGGVRDLELASRAAQGNWEANPELGERALKVLVARYANRADAELSKREGWVQAIAQIPGPESTAFLLERANQEDGIIKGHSAHSFFTLEASNTGPRGHALLREAWRSEEDTQRRFNLLWASGISHDQATHDFLIEVLQAERSHPHERVWVAERLAQEGPASQVAPLLKRANMRMRHAVFRPAMECLLWRWYG